MTKDELLKMIERLDDKARREEWEDVCVATANEIKSAQPERGTGQWIDTGGEDEWYGRIFKCSMCGETMIGETNCCPGCGKKMEQTPESRICNEITEAAETILRFFDKRFTDSVRSSDRVIVEDWKRFRTELERIYQIDREEVKEWLT